MDICTLLRVCRKLLASRPEVWDVLNILGLSRWISIGASLVLSIFCLETSDLEAHSCFNTSMRMFFMLLLAFLCIINIPHSVFLRNCLFDCWNLSLMCMTSKFWIIKNFWLKSNFKMKAFQLLAISWFWSLLFLIKNAIKSNWKFDFPSFWQYLGFGGCFF